MYAGFKDEGAIKQMKEYLKQEMNWGFKSQEELDYEEVREALTY